MTEARTAERVSPDHKTLIRDIVVLQVKLIVDGLRDLVLVPASVIVGMISLVSGKNGKPGTEFYRLLSVGKQSENWINLFAALEHAPPDMEQPAPFPDTNVDDIASRIEDLVKDKKKR